MEALSVDAGTPPRRAAGKRVLLAVCAACLLGGLEAAAKTYAQSPETVKAMLAESPRVRQMAQESPQIAKMLEDPKQIALMVKYLRELHASVRMMHQQMASRKGVQKLLAQVESLVQEVREVLADPEVRAMFKEGDIGVLPPLGVYDPLGLIQTKDMRR